jgi:predicted DCC family thiol-disulfide oxidoreductase YuxK
MDNLKVYYNSACPVCMAGIRYQKRRMAGCEVSWIDVHTAPETVRELGASLEFVRKRLHVVDPAGRLRVGIEAYRAVWEGTPGQRALATVFGFPLINRVTGWIYNAFAATLYAWNRAHRRW